MAFFVKITGSKSWVLSDVKVDNVVGVGSLHRNGKGISRVKGERDKSARRRVHQFDASGENLKFQKTRISPVKPKSYKTISPGSGSSTLVKCQMYQCVKHYKTARLDLIDQI
jgi:hypothetical protein